MRRGQVATEFIILIAVVILLFGASMLFILQQQQEQEEQTQREIIQDLAYALQQEVFAASRMHIGFQRNGTLPERINGRSYSIAVLNSNLYISQDGYELILGLPEASGTFSQDYSIERRASGVVIS